MPAPMPAPWPLLELTALLLAVWCIADAAHWGWRQLELLAGAIAGLITEHLAIAATGAYHYGGFLLWATPNVPLAIPAAWGALLYAAMKYSDSLGIPCWVRPAADGLYALMLDLSMDLVAVRLGLWTWETPAGSQWFGIPYANFGGWLLFAMLFSATVRILRAAARSQSTPAYGLGLLSLAALLPILTLILLNRLFTRTEQDLWPVGFLALLAVAILTGALLWRRCASRAALGEAMADAPPPTGWLDPALALPVAWHLNYLGIGVAAGALTAEAPLFVTGTMAAVGTLLVLGLPASARG